jgi:hypothetical protein
MTRPNANDRWHDTGEPWERPGQSGQDPSLKPPRREERERQYEKPGRASRVAAPPHEASPQAEKPYLGPPIPKRVEDRPTEDDIAQAALGGPKGTPALPPAPLTKTEDEQNSPNDEPGHVA